MVKVISGTPETFDVKAIVPFANAESGLPDGASVTERVSITSAYISFDVWRTLDRLQGRVVVFAELRDIWVGMLELDGAFLSRVSVGNSLCVRPSYPGRLILPRSLPIQPSTSTSSLRALGSVVHIVPASHISVRSWATTSKLFSILTASRGAPTKSSRTSTTR